MVDFILSFILPEAKIHLSLTIRESIMLKRETFSVGGEGAPVYLFAL